MFLNDSPFSRNPFDTIQVQYCITENKFYIYVYFFKVIIILGNAMFYALRAVHSRHNLQKQKSHDLDLTAETW